MALRKRVLIVQEVLAQYRLPFYEGLRSTLADHAVEVSLAHGSATGARAALRDEALLDWAQFTENSYLGPLVWQPTLRAALQADLVIVEHANRHVLNYLLVLLRRLRRPRPLIAFWGHGGNLQAQQGQRWRGHLRQQTIRWPDWWFAYTSGSAERVTSVGFDAARVTVVQNAIDVSDYLDVARTKRSHQCVFSGGLHQHKRIAYLLEAARTAADLNPNFRLHILGDGPFRPMVMEAATDNKAVLYHGPTFGHHKARIIAASELMLMPGLVGLAVLDAFAAETPMVTTAQDYHSPEVEYLKNGENGILLPRDLVAADYARHVLGLLDDQKRLTRLRLGCRAGSAAFSMEAMVARFADGILSALASRPRSGL